MFYKELKSALAERPPVSLRKKIVNKISAYTFENKINLYPLHEPLQKRRPEHLILAAASEKNSVPELVTKTYVDDGRDYLIKILTYGSNSKIFVFSTQDEFLKDFQILISPQNLRFHLKDNTEPLKIDQATEPEQITIEF